VEEYREVMIQMGRRKPYDHHRTELTFARVQSENAGYGGGEVKSGGTGCYIRQPEGTQNRRTLLDPAPPYEKHALAGRGRHTEEPESKEYVGGGKELVQRMENGGSDNQMNKRGGKREWEHVTKKEAKSVEVG